MRFEPGTSSLSHCGPLVTVFLRYVYRYHSQTAIRNTDPAVMSYMDLRYERSHVDLHL